MVRAGELTVAQCRGGIDKPGEGMVHVRSRRVHGAAATPSECAGLWRSEAVARSLFPALGADPLRPFLALIAAPARSLFRERGMGCSCFGSREWGGVQGEPPGSSGVRRGQDAGDEQMGAVMAQVGRSLRYGQGDTDAHRE